MQILNAQEVGLLKVVQHSIMIHVVCVKEKDISIIHGPKPHEVDMHVQEELFITSALLVLRLQQEVMLQQHRTMKMQDALLNMLRHGLQVAVQVDATNGTDIIIFFVRFAEESVILIQSGVLYM